MLRLHGLWLACVERHCAMRFCGSHAGCANQKGFIVRGMQVPGLATGTGEIPLADASEVGGSFFVVHQ